MVDRQFSDATLAALYDAFCPFEGRGDFGFYLPMVMAAEAVLDEAQLGDWTGAPLTDTSPEIITIARRD